jgi:hypothetical protein
MSKISHVTVSEHIFANIDSAGPDASWEKRRATAGTVIFELKLGVDIILDADGKYFVDAVTTTAGDVVHEWTEGLSTGRQGPRAPAVVVRLTCSDGAQIEYSGVKPWR